HVGASQTAADFDLDTLRALTHRLADGALDGAAVTDTPLQLPGNVDRDQISIGVGLVNLVDFNLHLLLGQIFKAGANLLHGFALASDQDARAGSVDRYLKLVGVALDFDARNTRLLAFLLDVTANGEVFREQ